MAAVIDALRFQGGLYIADPHAHSLAENFLLHATGDVLFDRLSDPFPLGYGLLKPSRHPDPRERSKENLAEARTFTDILIRRQGVESLAGSPLKDEYLTALILLYLNQSDA
ncbi:MAG TPA: hypothetical protein VD866_19035 [Urbifossiella sp.]|nr:hypothetical protein [Urbifossiella sp.]